MYDTVLYGNGLTLALQRNLKTIRDFEDFNSYFERILLEESQGPKEFYSILKSTPKSDVYLKDDEIIQTEGFLRFNLSDIKYLGFEVWIGKLVAQNPTPLIKNAALYYLALFNYWYNRIGFENSEFYYAKKACYLSFERVGVKAFYTLNYDTHLDSFCEVKHVHGSFVEEFVDVAQLAYHRYEEGGRKEFLHPFCAGTNGLEKLCSLNRLYSANASIYDHEFMFSKTKNFGNLLIYGIKFSDALLLPYSILQKYDEEKARLMKYVEGHILWRLEFLYQSGQVSSISICHYNDTDRERYKRIFGSMSCSKIVEFIPSQTIY